MASPSLKLVSREKKRSAFPATRWSLIELAEADNDDVRTVALSEILSLYQPALRSYLVVARRLSEDVADELIQQFIVDRIVVAGLLRKADRQRGKFRNFVLKSLNNFVNDKLRGIVNEKSRTVALDDVSHTLSYSSRAVYKFEEDWVCQIVRDALAMMETECEGKGRCDMWTLFCLRIVDPLLHGREPVDYDSLVLKLGLDTPRQAINLLASAKRVFGRHLRAAVGRYTDSNEAIDQEIADLKAIVER